MKTSNTIFDKITESRIKRYGVPYIPKRTYPVTTMNKRRLYWLFRVLSNQQRALSFRLKDKKLRQECLARASAYSDCAKIVFYQTYFDEKYYINCCCELLPEDDEEPDL